MDDILEPTPVELWHQRDEWIRNEIDIVDRGGAYTSDHSTALFFDMQRAYCAGAWISVVIMAIAVMDSYFRETESGDNNIITAKLLSDFYNGEDIDWLPRLRNRYVHLNLEKSFLEMNVWFNNQPQLEADATKAMKMTIGALFQNWGV